MGAQRHPRAVGRHPQPGHGSGWTTTLCTWNAGGRVLHAAPTRQKGNRVDKLRHKLLRRGGKGNIAVPLLKNKKGLISEKVRKGSTRDLHKAEKLTAGENYRHRPCRNQNKLHSERNEQVNYVRISTGMFQTIVHTTFREATLAQ